MFIDVLGIILNYYCIQKVPEHKVCTKQLVLTTFCSDWIFIPRTVLTVCIDSASLRILNCTWKQKPRSLLYWTKKQLDIQLHTNLVE